MGAALRAPVKSEAVAAVAGAMESAATRVLESYRRIRELGPQSGATTESREASPALDGLAIRIGRLERWAWGEGLTAAERAELGLPER